MGLMMDEYIFKPQVQRESCSRRYWQTNGRQECFVRGSKGQRLDLCPIGALKIAITPLLADFAKAVHGLSSLVTRQMTLDASLVESVPEEDFRLIPFL